MTQIDQAALDRSFRRRPAETLRLVGALDAYIAGRCCHPPPDGNLRGGPLTSLTTPYWDGYRAAIEGTQALRRKLVAQQRQLIAKATRAAADERVSEEELAGIVHQRDAVLALSWESLADIR